MDTSCCSSQPALRQANTRRWRGKWPTSMRGCPNYAPFAAGSKTSICLVSEPSMGSLRLSAITPRRAGSARERRGSVTAKEICLESVSRYAEDAIESRTGAARQGRKTLHRALRGGERDVAAAARTGYLRVNLVEKHVQA